MSQSDVKERVMKLFARSREFIEEEGWQEVFCGKEGLRLKCKLLVESLQPRGLCEEVATTVKYQARSAKEDEKELFKLILTKALEQDRDFQRRKRSRSKDQGERKRNDTNMHGGDSVQHRSKYRKVERNSGRQAGKGGATKQNPGKRATSSAPTGDCLKCKSDHWLVHSPTASADEKKELFQKMHELRDSNKAPKRAGRDA
ncbi:uncharacterized protein IUM83_06571 [Phytophthora cinnamomi]|uniref:uncharacterized protein n=1 Tax=Phytophthora cinnamomi TaxID=4785 RepID=UPI00355AB6D2|nr:hypothetical protein IUM83_06571 [Phytophthora cinnamomi]